MGTISELKQNILQKASISQVIGRFIKLKRNGAEFVGLCPFHNEKSPSFSVSEKKGIYKCFGCGESGDVIEFVKKQQNLNFVDALNLIANYENIPLQYEANATKHASKVAPVQNMNFIKKDLLSKTLDCYEANPFFNFVANRIGKSLAIDIFLHFFIGTAKEGGTIFWQVDQFLRIRTAQKIHYDEATGKRIKSIVPKRLFTTEQNYHPCLFGEHQLFDAGADDLIGIVESEKSAVLATIYQPEIDGRPVVWLACGGMNGLTEEKMFPLRGLHVVLVPDFHFISRMVWGEIPMRKRIDPDDGKLKPHPDGELQEDFVSRGALLQKLGCKVSFYDPVPELEDKSDIADLLLADNAAFLEKPNFDEFVLPE